MEMASAYPGPAEPVLTALVQIGGAHSSAASQLSGHKAPILQLRAGGPGLASGDRSGGLAVWDLTAGAASWRASNAHDGHITALAWAQPFLSTLTATPSSQEHDSVHDTSAPTTQSSGASEGVKRGTSSLEGGGKRASQGPPDIQLTASSSFNGSGSQQGDQEALCLCVFLLTLICLCHVVTCPCWVSGLRASKHVALLELASLG